MKELSYTREQDARFRELVLASADIVYAMSPDWKSLKELKGHGFIPDTVEPNENWLKRYIPPSDYGEVMALINQAISEPKHIVLEHRVIKVDGSYGWVLSRAIPIFDEQGEIVEWFGTASDITEHHRIEVELDHAREHTEQQKRLYETIMSSTPDLVYVFDLNYRFTYANQALLTMWGKTWETAIGKSLLENGYEDWHAAMHEREIDEVRLTRKSIRGEVSFPHAVLGKRIYDYIFMPVLNDQGEVEAVAGTTRDITEIRNAEMAITESESRFRTMAEGADVMISVLDEHGNGSYFNEKWSTVTGKNAASLMGKGWMELPAQDNKEQVIKTLINAFLQQKYWQFDFQITTDDGRLRWLLASGSPRRRQDGSFAGYICTAIDITEIKENEQRKNDFISMVSHELKTPLTSVMGYTQLLSRKLSDHADPFLRDILQRTEQQLTKMTSLINGFLNVARLESGKLPMQCSAFDFSDLLRDIEQESMTRVLSHQLLIVPPADPVFVYADREKIGQVIQNFIDNAVKYSPVKSTIEVVCEQVDHRIKLSVHDQGYGISDTNLPHLFGRYYRVENDKTKGIAGFGIGLYLCKEIIKAHDGEIAATSKLHVGSTFYFTLPILP